MVKYPTLGERLKLRAKYEPYMYKNYMVNGEGYHAMMIVFGPDGTAYVVMSSTALPLMRIVLRIEVFDDVKGGSNDGADRVSEEVQPAS